MERKPMDIDLTLPMSESDREEILIAIPQNDEENPYVWDGEVSDLFTYVFSDLWRDHMYSEYPKYYWKDVHDALKKRTSPTEIVVDIVYEFGATTEAAIREYMELHKDEGKRFLIMPRGDVVTMCCAYLRGYEIRDLDSL
jgi:hypothetical protein